MICCHKDDASFLEYWARPFQGGLYIGTCFFTSTFFRIASVSSKKTEGTENRGIRIQFDFNPARILDRLNLRALPLFSRIQLPKEPGCKQEKGRGAVIFLIEIHPFHASLYHVFQNNGAKNRPPAGDRLRFKGYTARESCSFPKPSSSRTSSQITIRAFLNPLKVVAEADV